MEIVRLDGRPGASRRSKWKEERVIRVWTPPGYSAEHYKNSAHGIPVLFMNDGKNLYEDWLAHQVSTNRLGARALTKVLRKLYNTKWVRSDEL